jgi:methyl-accepting chemotaxis protein
MKLLGRVRLGARLGAGFGVLVAALVVITLVGVTSLQALDASAKDSRQGKNLRALQQLQVIGQALESTGHTLVRHLYVHDGDLPVQDTIQKSALDAWKELERQSTGLRGELTSDEARAAYATFDEDAGAYGRTFAADLELSRQETVDESEEREGSRSMYMEQASPQIEKAIKSLDQVTAAVQTSDTIGSRTSLLVLVALLAIAGACAMAFLITRSVTRPVRALVQRLESVGHAELTELDRGLSALAEGDLTVQADASTAPLASDATDEIGQASRAVDGVIEKAQRSLANYNDSRGRLNAMIGEVSLSAGEVNVASRQVATTSDETGRAVTDIASAAGEVAQGSQRQVELVDSAKSAADEVSAAVRSTAEGAQETADAAGAARRIAKEGVDAAQEATTAMAAVREASAAVTVAIRALDEKSTRIEGIVGTITGIAEQTNLLALNAAIEAARAGEQGRGFAVVADEVRKLAEESQQAAGSISELVREIQAETGKAVQVSEEGARRSDESAATVDQTRQSFERIGSSVEDMTSRIEQIAGSAQQIAAEAGRMREEIVEVAAVAQRSSASAEAVSASTQETSASTQQIAASAEQLAHTAEELERLVSAFTLAPREEGRPAV